MFKILKGQDNREPEYVQVPDKDWLKLYRQKSFI
jgi:hypothetical protein